MHAPDIELFGSPTPNVFKVLIALEQTGLQYALKTIDIWKGEQFQDWFVTLNPNSKVPVLVDGSGSPTPHVVFESCAILMYIAEKTAIGLPNEARARSDVLQWLFFQASTLGPVSGQLNHFYAYAPNGQDYSRSRYRTEIARLFDVMERQLAKSAYFGSDAFSIADMAIYPWVLNLRMRYAQTMPFIDPAGPDHCALSDWVNRCGERPAVRRAQAVFSAIKSTLSAATAEERDRIFGRNAFARA